MLFKYREEVEISFLNWKPTYRKEMFKNLNEMISKCFFLCRHLRNNLEHNNQRYVRSSMKNNNFVQCSPLHLWMCIDFLYAMEKFGLFLEGIETVIIAQVTRTFFTQIQNTLSYNYHLAPRFSNLLPIRSPLQIIKTKRTPSVLFWVRNVMVFSVLGWQLSPNVRGIYFWTIHVNFGGLYK